MSGTRLAVLLWEGGCSFGLFVALVAAVVWRWLGSRPPARPAPAVRVGVVAVLETSVGGRHRAREVDLGDDRAGWRPAHTRAAARRRGRHFTGSRCWSGNLIEPTGELTAEQLARMMLGA